MFAATKTAQSIFIIALLFGAQFSMASACYRSTPGRQTLSLLWSSDDDQFSQLRLTQLGGQPDIVSDLNCTTGTPVRCTLSDDQGTAMFILDGTSMKMVMDGRLSISRVGEDKQKALAVLRGSRTSLSLDKMSDAACKGLFPADQGRVVVFPSGSPDKYDADIDGTGTGTAK